MLPSFFLVQRNRILLKIYLGDGDYFLTDPPLFLTPELDVLKLLFRP